jgi:hypothetical protein
LPVEILYYDFVQLFNNILKGVQHIRRRVEPPTVLFSAGQRRPVDNAIDRRYYSDPEEFFRSGRPFANCEGDEDFDYLLKHVGEDALMRSSDFPHGDPSAEENYVARRRERRDMPGRVKDPWQKRRAVLSSLAKTPTEVSEMKTTKQNPHEL